MSNCCCEQTQKQVGILNAKISKVAASSIYRAGTGIAISKDNVISTTGTGVTPPTSTPLGLQAVIDADPILTKDNTIDTGGFGFQFKVGDNRSAVSILDSAGNKLQLGTDIIYLYDADGFGGYFSPYGWATTGKGSNMGTLNGGQLSLQGPSSMVSMGGSAGQSPDETFDASLYEGTFYTTRTYADNSGKTFKFNLDGQHGYGVKFEGFIPATQTYNTYFQLDMDGNTHIKKGLFDGVGSKGTAGDILSSTGTGIAWVPSALTSTADTVELKHKAARLSLSAEEIGIGTDSKVRIVGEGIRFEKVGETAGVMIPTVTTDRYAVVTVNGVPANSAGNVALALGARLNVKDIRSYASDAIAEAALKAEGVPVGVVYRVRKALHVYLGDEN